ncbi:MAG: tRNA ((37)-N6)-threonylcarbamoyltransferase complex ATPase subunit type 1 TsaE [Cyanobacteriota bacterium]|jgi:tRNA threonylcarbamoyladenosine biosynthesis protein TsaE
MESRSVLLTDAAATAALGRELALHWLQQCSVSAEPPILLLQGDLGAGKTCLVQGIASGLGIDEAITSPTFALAQHYGGQVTGRSTALVHLDLYRLEQASAADELFAQEEEEALELGALMAVEWSERLSFVPEGAWLVQLELVQPDQPEAGRRATLQV